MTTRRSAIQSVLGAAACATAGWPQNTRSPRQPNLIILLADDLGYGDVKCFGSPDVPTPHIDSIAAGGARFTDGYVSAAVCSPSRAGLLTGRYQQRYGHEYNPGPARRDREQNLGLAHSEMTLPQALKKSGYATGMVGKWHLGSNPPFHPLARGFDEYFGFLSGANSYITSKTPAGQMVDTEDAPAEIIAERREPIYRGREPVMENEYLTEAFRREAVTFIDRHKKEPFFLYMAFNAVHTPLQATQKYLDRFANIANKRHRMLAAMTSAMDDAIGAIVSKIRESGLEKDTVICFLSDNGCPIYTRAGSNGPLNGCKCTYYEGGIRVPFAMQWPGHIPAGQTYRHPVVSRDIFPTFLNLAGARLPQDREYDGVDLMPYLTSKKEGAPHDILFWRAGSNSAARRGNWKLIAIGEDKNRLYDLATDIGEKKDLSTQHPDVVKELRAALKAWNAKLIAPRWEPRGTPMIPINGENIRWQI